MFWGCVPCCLCFVSVLCLLRSVVLCAVGRVGFCPVVLGCCPALVGCCVSWLSLSVVCSSPFLLVPLSVVGVSLSGVGSAFLFPRWLRFVLLVLSALFVLRSWFVSVVLVVLFSSFGFLPVRFTRTRKKKLSRLAAAVAAASPPLPLLLNINQI